MRLVQYNRRAAVLYAHIWAYGRNPQFYSYDDIGGDCTNFASQCLYAGSNIMNYTPTFGWYYISANQKAPAWTGVPYFYNFLTRNEESVGPVGVETDIDGLLPGDFVQFSFDGDIYQHTPIVVVARSPKTYSSVLVAAHSKDTDYTPISDYSFKNIRYIHIKGVYIP